MNSSLFSGISTHNEFFGFRLCDVIKDKEKCEIQTSFLFYNHTTKELNANIVEGVYVTSEGTQYFLNDIIGGTSCQVYPGLNVQRIGVFQGVLQSISAIDFMSLKVLYKSTNFLIGGYIGNSISGGSLKEEYNRIKNENDKLMSQIVRNNKHLAMLKKKMDPNT